MDNRKFMRPDGTISMDANTDQYASTVVLTSESPKYTLDKKWRYSKDGNMLTLKQVTRFVRLTELDEMPSWKQTQMVYWDREEVVVAWYNKETKELFVDDCVTANDRACLDVDEMYEFAKEVLFHQNKELYDLITSSFVTNVHMYKLVDGVFALIQSKERSTVIETMAKTVSPKTALKSIMNDIEIGSSKSKKAILSQTQMQSLKTLKLDDSIASFQRIVQSGVLSIDQVDELIQAMKYLIKFGFITHSDLSSIWSRYEDKIVEKKINMMTVFDNVLTSYLKYYDISGKYHEAHRRRGSYYGYYDLSFKKLLAIYLDAIMMLSDEQAANPKYYRTDNVEAYHAITVRNVKQLQNVSDEDFEFARVRLRKMCWENTNYIFRPFNTKEETAYAGSCLNNCLGACIQGICEGRVIIAAFRKMSDGTMDDCPEFVIEVTPHLDIIEASTYNNVDIADAERLKVIRDYIDSRRYLLSNGRSVYRDPDPEEEQRAKKAALKAEMNA
jgi:hypothetical protein